MASPILVITGSASSPAAGVAQKFAREAGVWADLIFTGAGSLPGGSWRRAWLVAPPTGGEMPPDALCAVLAGESYSAVALDDDAAGRRLAASLARRLSLPVVAQAVGIRRFRGDLQVIRHAEGGKKTAFLVPLKAPVIVVTSPTAGGDEGATGTTTGERIEVEAAPRPSLLEVLSETRLRPDEMDLSEADVVVAGGRGIGGAAGFAMLEELAVLLGGTVGASRVAVDAGWIPYSRQVGLTGKTVTPRLYVACGISGAPHHVLGMRNSSLIVAINSDAQAPIFKIAHVAVVARVEDVVPQLIREIRARQSAPVLAMAAT